MPLASQASSLPRELPRLVLKIIFSCLDSVKSYNKTKMRVYIISLVYDKIPAGLDNLRPVYLCTKVVPENRRLKIARTVNVG